MTRLYVYRAILVVLTAADVLCAVVSAPAMLMASLMLFDAPGSEQHLWVWALFFAGLSVPAWFVAGAVLGWVMHMRGWMLGSLAIAAAPLIAAAALWALLFD